MSSTAAAVATIAVLIIAGLIVYTVFLVREGREAFLSVLPFSHVYGMTAAMNVPVALGAAMIILPAFSTEM